MKKDPEETPRFVVLSRMIGHRKQEWVVRYASIFAEVQLVMAELYCTL